MFIPFVTLVFFDPQSTAFRLTLIPIVVGAPFVAIFQLKLIRLSSGELKRRMILIVLGEILGLVAILMGADIPQAVFFQDSDFLYALGIPIFMVAFFIIFLGIYKFPAFLEFHWKKNLVKLYIIDHETLKPLYTFDFTVILDDLELTSEEKKKKKEDIKALFSSGLIGIDGIVGAITDTKQSKIDKIKQGDSLILLEYGDGPAPFATYALLADEELESVRYFLREVKSQFQGFFKDLLLNLESLKGSEEILFSSFDIIIKNLVSK